MRFRTKLLSAILQGKVAKKFAVFIRTSEYDPVFIMTPPETEIFTASTKGDKVTATREELKELKMYLDVKSIEIGIDNE